MKLRKIRFNAIDFFVLLIVIAGVVAVALRGGLKDSLVAIRSNETIEYTVRINNLQERSYGFFEIDGKIFAQKDDKLLGEVKSIDVKPAEKYVVLDDGTVKKTVMPGRIDVYLTVEAKGRITEEGCFIGGNYFVSAGKYVEAYTANLSFNFEVTDAYKKQ